MSQTQVNPASKFRLGMLSHVGMKRQQNQDSVFADPHLGLFIVADGMGGHQGGETASRMAVEVIQQFLEEFIESQNLGTEASRIAMTRAIELANTKIYAKAQETPSLQGMGTTTSCALFYHSRALFGQVGDSRGYLIRQGGLWQVTRDHSLIQEKIRAGILTREQSKTESGKNIITRSVGYEAQTQVELFELETLPGDLFLICSDGLTGLVEK